MSEAIQLGTDVTQACNIARLDNAKCDNCKHSMSLHLSSIVFDIIEPCSIAGPCHIWTKLYGLAHHESLIVVY